jgi:hypothetical protein
MKRPEESVDASRVEDQVTRRAKKRLAKKRSANNRPFALRGRGIAAGKSAPLPVRWKIDERRAKFFPSNRCMRG